jgi:hypothetical protein
MSVIDRQRPRRIRGLRGVVGVGKARFDRVPADAVRTVPSSRVVSRRREAPGR